MKIVVLSDIHANVPALDAALQHVESIAPDAVVIGGDVINRGAQPREALEVILDKVEHHGWHILKGNHEDYVLQASRGVGHLAGWEQAVCAHTVWTAERITDYLPTIADWPDSVEVAAPDGSRLACFHASRKGNRVGLYQFMADEELHEHVHGIHSALCVGHTHVPFVRYVEGTLIVNAGAVGMPFDGNPAASLTLIEWSPGGWKAEIIRIPYDRRLTLASFRDTGYLTDAGIMVRLIVRELQHAKPMLGKWHARYEQEVAAGRMTLEDSVDRMLAEDNAAVRG